jgi:hypothetical protein
LQIPDLVQPKTKKKAFPLAATEVLPKYVYRINNVPTICFVIEGKN